MLALGRYSKWSRSELRQLSIAEFQSYFETAEELAKDTQEQ